MSGFTVNGTNNLDNIFQLVPAPHNNKVLDVNIKNDAIDISNRYLPYTYGDKASITNYNKNNIDLKDIFAKKMTTYLNIYAQATNNGTSYTGSLSLYSVFIDYSTTGISEAKYINPSEPPGTSASATYGWSFGSDSITNVIYNSQPTNLTLLTTLWFDNTPLTAINPIYLRFFESAGSGSTGSLKKASIVGTAYTSANPYIGPIVINPGKNDVYINLQYDGNVTIPNPPSTTITSVTWEIIYAGSPISEIITTNINKHVLGGEYRINVNAINPSDALYDYINETRAGSNLGDTIIATIQGIDGWSGKFTSPIITLENIPIYIDSNDDIIEPYFMQITSDGTLGQVSANIFINANLYDNISTISTNTNKILTVTKDNGSTPPNGDVTTNIVSNSGNTVLTNNDFVRQTLSTSTPGTYYIRYTWIGSNNSPMESSYVTWIVTGGTSVSPSVSPSVAPAVSPSVDTNTVNTDPNDGTCLKYGTPVLMADNTWKNIEDLLIGDEVVSATIPTLPINEYPSYFDWWSTTTLDGMSRVTTTVANTSHKTASFYYKINDIIEVTDTHIVLAKKSDNIWKFYKIFELDIGDSIIDDNDKETPIVTKERIDETVNIVKLDVTTYDLFYTKGLLSHNLFEVK